MKIVELFKSRFRRTAVHHEPQEVGSVSPLSAGDLSLHAVVVSHAAKSVDSLPPVGHRSYPLLREAWVALRKVEIVAEMEEEYRPMYQPFVALPEEQRRAYQALVDQERRHLEEAAGRPVTNREFDAYMEVWRSLCADEAAGGTEFQEFVEGLEGVKERRQRQRIEQAIAQDSPSTIEEPVKRRKI